MSKNRLEKFEFDLQKPNITYTLTQVPQRIATINISSDSDDVVKLVGNIGWIALDNQDGLVEKVDVIFEIWRGPVGVGTPIYRATDSAQASNTGSGNRLTFDNLAVTSVVHVDETAGNHTYHLTARLGTVGESAAMVIGPITFYGEEIDVS